MSPSVVPAKHGTATPPFRLAFGRLARSRATGLATVVTTAAVTLSVATLASPHGAAAATQVTVVARYRAGTFTLHQAGHAWTSDARLHPGGKLVTQKSSRYQSHGRLYMTSRHSVRTYRFPVAQAGHYSVAFSYLTCSKRACAVHTSTRSVTTSSRSLRTSVPAAARAHGVTTAVVRRITTVRAATVKPAPVKPAPVKPAPVKPAPAKTAPSTTATTATTAPTVAPSPASAESTAASSLLMPQNFEGPASVWHQDISRAPLAANSAAQVANLTGQVAKYYGGTAAFNAYRYNVSWYNATAATPITTLGFTNCQNKPKTPAGLFGLGGQFVDVPIPANAVASTGTDATMDIYRASTDQLWELWRVVRTATGWSACWGGRIDHVSTNPGYFANGFGASATGLTFAAGEMSITDARAGRIDHAIDLAIPETATWKNVSWPAQRSDGASNVTGADAIPEGTRLRLDPTVNVDALHLSPLAAMIAKAAQKYGFIVTDKAGCVSVGTESGVPTKNATGTDPWDGLLKGVPTYKVMANFPWSSLQALPANYGKP